MLTRFRICLWQREISYRLLIFPGVLTGSNSLPAR
jgi:hypothetical protein